MKPDRMRRVDESIRKVLADVLQREVKDPRVGFATITGVRTSSDLSHAQVLVSVLEIEEGSGHTPQDTLDGLRSAVGFLQRRVGEELGLKNTPLLRFEIDDTVDRALRIQALLDDPPPPAVPTPEDEGDDAPPDTARDDAAR